MKQNSIRIIKTKDYKDFSIKSANIVASAITLNPNLLLGMATGSTPEGMYDRLIDIYKEGNLDFLNVKTINLDEYVGLPQSHSQSYRHYMDNKLFNHININKSNTYLPDAMSKDLEKECDEYEELISDLGGIDFQILGIGTNGHIGFNEPNSYFSKKTLLTKLTSSTIEANSRLFDSIDDVPKTAISMGVGTIFKAKQIMLMANGSSKAEIIKKALFGEITPEVPASILQLHSNVILVVDEEAGKYIN